MKLLRTLQDIQTFKEDLHPSSTLGFVPTMGALHQGHLSLIEKAKAMCEVVVVSIFVNPTQFGKTEDFGRYPRPEAEDLSLLRSLKCQAVFLPSIDLLYPEGTLSATQIRVPKLEKRLCGKSRPGHFKGVCMVVHRLLNLITPTHLFLGEKDFQQLIILSRMCKDLFVPVSIVPCPILREADGLAMSSRNRYLSQEERPQAASIYKGLSAALSCFQSGERKVSVLRDLMVAELAPAFHIDYIQVVDPKTLTSRSVARVGDRLVFAGTLGKTRLIDNLRLS